jgi:hypothetical protein
MKPKRKPRLLVVASGGGHWVQILRLRPAFVDFDVAYVSVHRDYADSVQGHRFYCVYDFSRANLKNLLVLIPQIVGIVLRERPEVVITTGSAPGLVSLAVAKHLVRAKTVWIDSIANCEQMSSSGKRARRFADAWLTQWPELATVNGAEFWGAVL